MILDIGMKDVGRKDRDLEQRGTFFLFFKISKYLPGRKSDKRGGIFAFCERSWILRSVWHRGIKGSLLLDQQRLHEQEEISYASFQFKLKWSFVSCASRICLLCEEFRMQETGKIFWMSFMVTECTVN